MKDYEKWADEHPERPSRRLLEALVAIVSAEPLFLLAVGLVLTVVKPVLGIVVFGIIGSLFLYDRRLQKQDEAFAELAEKPDELLE